MPTITISESSKDEFAQQICFLFNLRLGWLPYEEKITLSTNFTRNNANLISKPYDKTPVEKTRNGNYRCRPRCSKA
jgi:hypothetical protein